MINWERAPRCGLMQLARNQSLSLWDRVMWRIATRRATFLFVLLATGALTVSCFHYAQNSIRAPSPQVRAFGIFAWGADSAVLVLGMWLAGRWGVWRTWSGWIRAATYVVAFAYGRMLFSAVQDWLIQRGTGGNGWAEPAPFRWPGGSLEDYARPALDLLALLVLVWLLVPIFTLVRGSLVDEKSEVKSAGTYSLASILGWTATAALILVWIRLLTWKGVSPQTAYSYMTPTQALTEYVVDYLPSSLIVVAWVFLLAWSWSGKWWLPIAALVGALLIDSFGHKALYALLTWTRGSSFTGGVLAGPALEHWSYVAGRTCMAWGAFGLARLLGVRFGRSLRITPN